MQPVNTGNELIFLLPFAPFFVTMPRISTYTINKNTGLHNGTKFFSAKIKLIPYNIFPYPPADPSHSKISGFAPPIWHRTGDFTAHRTRKHTHWRWGQHLRNWPGMHPMQKISVSLGRTFLSKNKKFRLRNLCAECGHAVTSSIRTSAHPQRSVFYVTGRTFLSHKKAQVFPLCLFSDSNHEVQIILEDGIVATDAGKK